MTRPVLVPKKISGALHRKILKIVENELTGTTLPVLKITEHVIDFTQIFLYGKVHNARVVLYDRIFMVRISIRYAGKSRSMNTGDSLWSLINQIPSLTGGPYPKRIQDAVLAALPQDELAIQTANIANAAASALVDPAKTSRVRSRLQKLRSLDKERLMASIRRAFSAHDGMLTESEVVQMWRETLVGQVMDS